MTTTRTDPVAMAEPSAGGTRPLAQDTELDEDELIEEEVLVEEISIDGMCGVY